MATPRQGSRAGAKKKPIRRAPGAGSFHDTATGVRYRATTGATATGKAIQRDFYGRTREEAIAKAEAYKQANPQGPPSSDASQSLDSFLLTWLRVEIAPKKAVSTLESYSDTLDLHVSPILGAVPMCDLKTLQLQAWVNELGQKRGRTAEYALAILKAALNTAVRWKIIKENPAQHVEAPAYKKRKSIALTLPQVKALIAAAAGRLDVRKSIKRKGGRSMPPAPINTRYAFLYLLYVALGTRRGELLALRWSDIDLETGAVQIERSLDKHQRERGTKTDAGQRLLYLDAPLLAGLRLHRERMLSESHDEARRPDGLVFPSEDGTPINPSNLRRHFQTVLAAAGLPLTIRLHDLRHTAASLMLARGSQLVDVSKTLGHSSTSITGDIYAHAYEEGKRKAIASVSEALQ